MDSCLKCFVEIKYFKINQSAKWALLAKISCILVLLIASLVTENNKQINYWREADLSKAPAQYVCNKRRADTTLKLYNSSLNPSIGENI